MYKPIRLEQVNYNNKFKEPADRCKIKGCGRECNARKPYCIEHLNKISYVKSIQIELNRREKEIENAKKTNGWKKVDTNSEFAQEIIEIVRKGAVTLQRLTVTMKADFQVIKNYLIKLEQKEIISVMRLGSRRGSMRQVVSLIQK